MLNIILPKMSLKLRIFAKGVNSLNCVLSAESFSAEILMSIGSQ